jgi:cytochrome c-type biogenesis protein CcmH/NrfF
MMNWAAAVAILLALACESAPAEQSEDSRQVQSIVRTTNSPFCPGKTLDSCPSPRAAEWRRDINEWVEDGVPENEIRNRLQDRVPGFELAPQPVASGWIIPLIAVVLSTLWLVLIVRSLRQPPPPRRKSPAPVDPVLDARLDEELERDRISV